MYTAGPRVSVIYSENCEEVQERNAQAGGVIQVA
jgi:hypothetical protein